MSGFQADQSSVCGCAQICVYPALHELPKATIRALAARKRIDSGGESTGDEVIVDNRKRVKASAEWVLNGFGWRYDTRELMSSRHVIRSQGATSVDAYMNEIDDQGNIRNEYGLLVPAVEPRPVPLGFYSYQQQLYAQQKQQQFEHQRQEELQAKSGSASGSNGAMTTSSSAAPPYTVSAQGYSSSISSYHLNATSVQHSTVKGDSPGPRVYNQAHATSNLEHGLYHATVIDQSGGREISERAVSGSDYMTDHFRPPANNGFSGGLAISQNQVGFDRVTPPTMAGHGPLMTNNNTNAKH